MSDGVSASFEEKLARIDAIVQQLEGGQVALDKAVELFKEGKTLARECEALLKGAQETLEKATADDER